MSLNKEHVIEALRTIADAASGRDLVSLGAVKKVAACDGFVTLEVGFSGDAQAGARLRSAIEAALKQRAQQIGAPLIQLSVAYVDVHAPSAVQAGVSAQGAGAASQGPARSAPSGGEVKMSKSAGMNPDVLPGVRHVIAVGAGKGGVGKSTVSLNLAVGLARRGHAVGVLDGDIYGPSMPTLLGLDDSQVSLRGNMLVPFMVHGIKAMTIGKLVDPEKPLIWRGPMAHGAFKQLTEQTEWGELDYLIIDLPPGTGDVSLTMAQLLKLTGAIVVCTPQKVAQDDAVRAARMFQQLGIDVLGVVENMSFFVGDDGKEYDLFGRGGARTMAQRLGLPYLGGVPIHMELRANSDAGNPAANFEGNRNLRDSLEALVNQVEAQVALAAMRNAKGGPVLTVS